jgi:mitochondrial fission protein ELM1
LTASPIIWLLIDDRMSHRSQICGVAERLGFGGIEKELHYNRFAALANGPFGARLWHLTSESRRLIAPPWPDLVIAAGRRSAPVALAVKRRSPKTRLAHLMWPDVSPKRFDVIAVPEHDTLSYNGANLLRTFGAPHSVTLKKITNEAVRWHSQVNRLPFPRIALLIGGSARGFRYEPDDFKTLAAHASAEAERLGGSLLVTSSPRTGEAAENLIKPFLVVPHLFHSWKPGQDNPYMALLGLADAIITTGDSISMCSEACATGKPVYIFVPPHLARDKNEFRETLFARGFAKPHTYPVRPDWRPEKIPDAAEQVAEAIREL